jgi:hypothetical protein
MNSRIASLAAAAVFAVGVVVAPGASAGGNVAVSIGLPGFSVGYSNHGYGFIAAAPVPYYAAPYYAPVAPYVPAPVVYAPYYRPYAVRPYYAARPYYYRPPVRVGYYGYARH